MKKAVNLIFGLTVVAISSASANANDKNSVNDMVALMLNLNGHLCATVKNVTPLRVKDQYEVTCIAYRDGSATKTYVLNATTGKAFEQ